MGNLGGTFNPNEHKGADILPAGEYRMLLTKLEHKENSKHDGTLLQAEFTVVAGPQQNRKLFQRFNYSTKDTSAGKMQAVQIGKGQFSKLCRALGHNNVDDTSDLFKDPANKSRAKDPVFIGRVTIRKAKEKFPFAS